MSTPRHSRLLILGSGPAGYAAAVYAARANRKPVLITGMEEGGQLMTTVEVDNWPGDPHGLTGPALMERMRKHAERFNTEVVNDHINKVDLSQRPFHLEGDRGNYTCDALIIATGATAKYLGLAIRAELPRPRRVRLRDLRRLLLQEPEGRGRRRRQYRRRRSAVSLEHRLARHARPSARHAACGKDPAGPSVREASAKARCSMVWNHTVDEVLGDDNGVTGLRVAADRRRPEARSRRHRRLHRRRPRAEHATVRRSARNEERLPDRASPVSSGNATQTSVPGVFAAGDVADHVYRQAITSAGTGCMAALDADKYLDQLDAAQALSADTHARRES